MTIAPSDTQSEKELTRAKKLKFLHHKKKSERFTNNDILGILTLATIALNILVLGTQFLLFRSYIKLATKPAPSLVELSSGKAIQVAEIGSKDRTSDVILNFTEETLSLLLTWTGTLPNSDGEEDLEDPGVKISDATGNQSTTVTTSAFQAGFALSEDFRKEFLLELGAIMPPDIFNGASQVVFVPLEVSRPVQIETGKWRLNVVANLMIFNEQNVIGKPIAFNKEIFLQAVEAPEFDPELTGFAQAVQQIRASGLEIYSMRDL